MSEESLLPPNNVQAEQSILGILISDSESFDHIHAIKPAAFYKHIHQLIYRAISSMLQDGKQLDALTLAEHLDAQGKLQEVGGVAYLGGLAQSAGSVSNIKRYAEIIQEKYLLRELISASNSIAAEAHSHGDIQAKINKAQSIIMAITDNSQSSEPKFVKDVLPECMDYIDALYQEEIKPISTGLVDLDKILGGGFAGGQLIIVAGRPSMGKTAFSVGIAKTMQTREAAAVVFSCEMPNAQIVNRLLSTAGRIDSNKLRTGQLDDDDFENLTAAVARLSEVNMLVDDQSQNLAAITAKSRSIKRKHGLSVIVVDYVQLLEGVGDNREQQIASISRGLKRLAIELDVPVIALSQLNRNVDSRPNKRPTMSDLRESGALEQDADTIILIYRDEVYNPDSEYKGTAELIIGKQRAGMTGTVRATFLGEYTSFENYTGGEIVPRETKSQKRGFDYAGY